VACTGGIAGDECQFDHSKGVTAVRRVATGQFCVTVPGINAADTPAAVTVDSSSSSSAGAGAPGVTTHADGCISIGSTDQFEVRTTRQPNITVDANGGTNNATAAGLVQAADSVGFTIVIP